MTAKLPIFLSPVFQDRIWGGTKLRELFGYAIPTETTGECWAVSAHPNGQSVVNEGPYAGMKLGELWERHPELFGSPSNGKFPLLIKILDASDDLSVQVHPDDEYAGANENGELGKTECWYVLQAEPGAEIIFGHTAQTKEQLTQMIRDGRWDELLTRVPVRQGDFFYVQSGTIHALGQGIVVLETQQSSDTTYRVYDYDRRDAGGNTRELHLDKAIDVTTVPHRSSQPQPLQVNQGASTITTLVSNDFFTVEKWEVEGAAAHQGLDRFKIFSVVEGNGSLTANGERRELRKGEHFIMPAGSEPFAFEGRMSLIASLE